MLYKRSSLPLSLSLPPHLNSSSHRAEWCLVMRAGLCVFVPFSLSTVFQSLNIFFSTFYRCAASGHPLCPISRVQTTLIAVKVISIALVVVSYRIIHTNGRHRAHRAHTVEQLLHLFSRRTARLKFGFLPASQHIH